MSSTTARSCSPIRVARVRSMCAPAGRRTRAASPSAMHACSGIGLRSIGRAFASSATTPGSWTSSTRARCARVYYPEMEALVKAESGAARVVVFDHTLRTADDELRESRKIREVVRRVHNDYTEWSGPQRVRDLLPDEADELLSRRFAIIQVWRPIRHPVETHPLAICDARSISTEDFVVSERRYPNRIGQTYAITYNPGPSLVLAPAHAARGGAGVQGLRFGQGRPRALVGPYRVRRPDHAAQCAPAREHRDPHAGVLLSRYRALGRRRFNSPTGLSTPAGRLRPGRRAWPRRSRRAPAFRGRSRFRQSRSRGPRPRRTA